VKNVTGRRSNPFGFTFPCDRAVPGYGDANADFHVLGDHPGVHGGVESGVPFTENEAADRLQQALLEGGMLTRRGSPPVLDKTYFSYLSPCVTAGEPSDDDYAAVEPILDSEVRAITAHVLLPVGERATRWVFANMSRESPGDVDMAELHATEISGSGWLIYPIADPTTWTGAMEQSLVDALSALRASDYRRTADLGRFQPGGDPYLVR
jgi:uracil-DNA glycosylase